MKKDLVSVIVPVYKVEKYLDRCIESIVNQTYKNLEIILIDDGSPDNCPKMCDEWAKRDKRIKVIHKENAGVSCARNTGLDIATGEYIGFVDSDDYIHPDMYNYLLTSLEENKKINFSYCDVIRDDKVATNLNYDFEIIDKSKRISDIFPFNGGIWSGLYSRKLINKFNLKFDSDYYFGEDLIYIVNYLLKATKNIIHVKIPLYHYLINEGSITNTINKEKKLKNSYNFFKSVSLCYKNIIDTNEYNTNIITKNYIDFLLQILKKNKNINFKNELIEELKQTKEYFNFKQKLFYQLVKYIPNSLYYIDKIIIIFKR